MVSLLAIFLTLAASSTVFAAQKAETYTINEEAKYTTNDAKTISADITSVKYVTESWGWNKVGYDKNAPTGQGKCNLKAADNVNVVCEPAGKSDNEWKIVVGKDFKLDDKYESVAFDMFYQVQSGKSTKTYVATFTVTGPGPNEFDLNQYCKDVHGDPLSKINSVALGTATFNEKPAVKPKIGQLYVWVPVIKWNPIYKNGAAIYEDGDAIYEDGDAIYEDGDAIYSDIWTTYGSVTATNDANNPTIVKNSNHFRYATLNLANLVDGITLDLIVGNKATKLGEVLVKLNDEGNLVITLIDGENVKFGAQAFTKILEPNNGNIHSAAGFHDNNFVIDCPAADENGNIYLYIHSDLKYITGQNFEGYEQIFVGYEQIFKGYEQILVGYEQVLAGYMPYIDGWKKVQLW